MASRGYVVTSTKLGVTGFVVNDSSAARFLVVPVGKDATLGTLWIDRDETGTENRSPKWLDEILALPASSVGEPMANALQRTRQSTPDYKLKWERVGYLFFGPSWRRQITGTPITPWTEGSDWLR